MASGGLILDYLVKGVGAPSAFAFPGGSTGVPSLGNNSTETARYLNTTNNHEYAWDGAAWQDVTAGGGGTTRTRVLQWSNAADVTVTLTSSTWTDVFANQTFTLAGGSSLIEFAVRGYLNILSASGNPNVAFRLAIDSAGTPSYLYLGGQTVNPSTGTNGLTGAGLASVSALASGAHTVKLQGYSAGVGSTAYCRTVTFPIGEIFTVEVFENH